MNAEQLKELSGNYATARALPVFVNGSEQKRYMAVWNNKTNTVASIPSTRYNIVQHPDLLCAISESLSTLGLDFQADIREDKHRLFLDLYFPSAVVKLENVGESFIAGLRVINSYDTSTGVMLMPMLKRLVCSNGAIATAFVSGVYLRHSNSKAENFSIAIPELIKRLIESNEKFKMVVSDALADSVAWNELKAIMPKIMAIDKHREQIESILAGLNQENLTRWDIYNAVTYYLNHTAKITPTRELAMQKQAQNILLTPLISYTEKQ